MGRAERRAQERIKKRGKQHKDFIHQEQRWSAHVRELLPKINAAFAYVMWKNHGLTQDEIYTDVTEMQDLWLADGTGFNILKLCAEETGINFVSKVTADAFGIEEGEHETYEGVEM